MSEDINDKQMNSSNEEMTRHMYEIFSYMDDPDYLEKKRIEQNREARFDKSDLSI